MSTIAELIKRGCCYVGRRASIKRRDLNGNYEADWFDISDYVISWGEYEQTFGDVVFTGDYQINGGTLELNNGLRRFNDQTQSQSFFYKFLTRHLTKVKIELFFIDDDDSEVAGLVWYGILYSEPEVSDDGRIKFSFSSTLKVLQNYPATGIATGSASSSTIITNLVTKTSGGVRLFDRFFEGANDAAKYKVNPEAASVLTIPSLTINENNTVWDVIKRISLYNDFYATVDNSGAFVWQSRAASANVQWKFNGAGSFDNDYAINIISIDNESDGVNNIWNKAVVEYGAAGAQKTSTVTWAPGDRSSQDYYGERIYTITAPDLDASTAQTVADNFRVDYQSQKKVWEISTPVIPQLNTKDKVTISYVGELITNSPFILGISKLGGTDVLGLRSGSINLSAVTAKIISIKVDLDALESSFTLEEV